MMSVGLDEVGRGAFAGPLVTGCVAIDETISRPSSIIITDSKKLTPLQRERAADWIFEHATAWGIGQVSPKTIDKLGITKSVNIAFRQAIGQVQKTLIVEELFIDAFFVPRVNRIPQHKQHAIIHGDSKVFSIAAASIIAKVYRDQLMCNLHEKFYPYRWDANKGYGTRVHREAIKKYGSTKHHRSLFLRKINY